MISSIKYFVNKIIIIKLFHIFKSLKFTKRLNLKILTLKIVRELTKEATLRV